MASYKSMLHNAIEAGRKRDYAEAEELLSRIVSETDGLPEAWLFLGRARHARGDFERAALAYRRYLELRPDDASGWFFSGRSWLALGRPKYAISCFRAAIAKGKTGSECWALLGFAELRARHAAKAVECLERAVNASPDDSRVYRGYLNALYVHGVSLLRRGDAEAAAGALGFVIDNGLDTISIRLVRTRALRLAGRIDEAIEDLEAAIRQAPGDVSLRLHMASLKLAAGDPETALAIMDKYGVKPPDGSVAEWTESALDRFRALSAFKAGNYRESLAAAIDRIKAGDRDAAIRALAAQANLALGRFARAVEHFRRAMEADPASPELRLGLAHAFLEARDFTAAKAAAKAAAARGAPPADTRYVETICAVEMGAYSTTLMQDIRSLLKAHPADPRLMMAYAECLYKSGDPELAIPWFDKVVELSPGHDLASLYGIASAESLGDVESARTRYALYLAEYPDNSSIRKDYVRLLVELGAWADAAVTIEEGRGLGQLGGADRLLAVCYRNARRFADAAALYRRELRAHPKDVDTLLGLSYCLTKSGSSQSALELLEKGSAFIGTRTEPYLALGLLRMKRGDSEKAVAALLKASELAPADPRPLRNLAKVYAKAGVLEMAASFDAKAQALETKVKQHKKREKG